MLQAWQKRLLNNTIRISEEWRTGDHTLLLPPAKYRITLIGIGGNSDTKKTLIANRPVLLYDACSATGGVGGTLIVEIKTQTSNEITVHCGQRDGDRSTNIIGLPGLILSAGGGTDAQVTSAYAGTGGQQGTNILEGNVLNIINNNNIEILPIVQTYSRMQYPPTLQLSNSNYPDNPTYGKTGEYGFAKIETI